MRLISKLPFLLTALALTLCQGQPAAFAAAAPDKSGALFPDPVVASGKGFEIHRSQLDDAFLTYSTSLAANGGGIQEDQRDMVRSNLLQHLIVSRIMNLKATVDDKARIAKLVDESIAEARKAAPTPEAFEAQIKASGMTLDLVRKRACEEQILKLVLERETTNGISITDTAVKKFYDDNPSDFDQPEQVRVSHILISTLDPQSQTPLPPEQKKAKEKFAQGIRARAVSGEDFAKLVKLYSDDPGSKEKGGEYKFGKGRMVPEFEAASFSMKVGQISDLVETRYGYHIIKLLEKYPAKHEQFAEVQVKIKDYLVKKQAEAGLPAYLARVKSEAGVKITDTDAAKPAAH